MFSPRVISALGLDKNNPKQNYTSTNPILAVHSEVPREEYNYKWNSDGLRSVELSTKPEIIVLGCSITLGQGMPQELRWSDLLSNQLETSIGNISYSGAAINKNVSSFLGMVHQYQYIPRTVIAHFANFERFYFVDPHATSMQDWYINHKQKKTKASAPWDYEEILPYEWVYYQNLDHIKMLEAFCESNGINLMWTTWSNNLSEEQESFIVDNFRYYVKDTVKEQFPKDFEFYVGPDSVDKLKPHYEMHDWENIKCHNEYKEKYPEIFDHAYDYHKIKGHWGPGAHWPHPGLHKHLHIADFWYTHLINSKFTILNKKEETKEGSLEMQPDSSSYYVLGSQDRHSVLLPETTEQNLFVSRAHFEKQETKINIHGCSLITNSFQNLESRMLDVRSPNKKLIVPGCNSIMFSMHELLGEILTHFEHDPSIEIIYLSEPGEKKFKGDLFNFTFKLFDDYNIKYKFVDDSYTSIVADNFYVFRNSPNTAFAPLIYKYISKYIRNINNPPFRKLYITRSHMPEKGWDPTTEKYSYNKPRVSHDNRLDNHTAIENYFQGMGFEVVVPENFSSFEEQINYFNQAKCVASLSGSGLTNILYMQPGQTVLEITTPLTHDKGSFYEEEIHFYYSMISLAKNHFYMSIPNINRKSNYVTTNINNKNLFHFLRKI